MRILFLSHRFPYPPTFGSKVRAFNIIKHLAKSHEVTVLSMTRSDAEEAEAAGIASFCSAHRVFRVHNPVQALKVALTLPTTVTASEAFFHSAELQREVRIRLEAGQDDLVFAHCSAVGRYVEPWAKVPVVMDFCDVDSRKWFDYVAYKPWPLSLGYAWEARRLADAERRMARRFDAVTVATAGEVQALREIGIADKVECFPNGVDFDYFRPTGDAYDENLVVFVGRMDYFPNEQCMVDFCDRVWPQLRRARPQLRLRIVGAAPTARVQALARTEGVEVTGSVPDVRPHVRAAAVAIAPLQIARGTQNKILEAMAMAVPVVASRVAAAGVDAVAGEHLLVADSPAEACEAILRIVGMPEVRSRLANAGRERALARHDWPSAMRRLDAIIDRAVGERRRPVSTMTPVQSASC